MGNDSHRIHDSSKLLMSDLIEGDDSSSMYSNHAIDDSLNRRSSNSSNSLASFGSRNQANSTMTSKSILDMQDSEKSIKIKPESKILSNARPRPNMPAILKKGRSMPFIDPNDQFPLSPIHESPHRDAVAGQRYFFGDKSAVSCATNSPKKTTFSSFFGISSPKVVAVQCKYELAAAIVDDIPTEDLGPSPTRRVFIPELKVSESQKVAGSTGLYFRTSPRQATDADSVLEFKPPPMLKNAKKWASEGNILKLHNAEFLNETPDDDLRVRVVNGSPDVERAQKKIEYIVEAVAEVGMAAGVVQTPRLALSRHNSKIDPKMLDDRSI